MRSSSRRRSPLSSRSSAPRAGARGPRRERHARRRRARIVRLRCCFEEPSADCVAFTQCTSTRRAAEIAPCVQAPARTVAGRSAGRSSSARRTASPSRTVPARCAAVRPPLIERVRTDGGIDRDARHRGPRLPGGHPGCRTSELSVWCTSGHECKPSRRRCMPITIDGTSSDPAEISAQIASAFGSWRRPRRGCAGRAGRHSRRRRCEGGRLHLGEMDPRAPLAMPLVGCAYSCPVLLTSVSGPVLVDVDVFRTTCSVTLVEGCCLLPRRRNVNVTSPHAS